MTLRGDNIEIVSVSRSAGALRRVKASSGKIFLVLEEPGTRRFLEEGKILDAADVEELEGPLAQRAGMARAIRFLSRRERTEREVREILRAEGIENQRVIDYIVETLKDKKLLDDRRFASELIEYRMKHNPAGPLLLRRKLADAGVAAGIIDELLADSFPAGEEKRVAMRLSVARLSRKCNAGPGGGRCNEAALMEKSVRRLNGYLMRRGFSAGVVADICAGVLRGEITGETNEQ
jgi:SOS response regulatory protein OraA/RecX